MKKILYLNSFTVKATDFGSSDAVGYGITSSDALFQSISKDYQLIKIPTLLQEAAHHAAYLEWTLASYHEVLAHLQSDPPDAIFIFHSFQQFPQELKKMLYHLKLNIPLIGYTHGSHWDPTDTFRHMHCPELHLSDLANLNCLDAILFVSHTFKNVVIENIARFNADIAEVIAEKSFVVGLPINTALIDSFAVNQSQTQISIVFNHAPIPSKKLSIFLNIMDTILKMYPQVICHITRHIPVDAPEYSKAQQLLHQYTDRFVLHKTLPIADYCHLLWQADMQVSTASHESLGVATLEAMYTHNCCILPKIGAYPEISNGITDHLYEDENELLQKLIFYIEHPEERIELGQRLAIAAKKFSMPNLKPHLIQVLNQFL